MSVSFHLCQPGRGASCGACCGLYNFRDHSRATLTERLGAQTDTFAPLPREPEAYGAAARALKEAARLPSSPPCASARSWASSMRNARAWGASATRR